MRTLLAVCAILTASVLRGAPPEKATLGAGCFWCVEAIYEQLPGVLDVVSGYAGGTEKNPTYRQVGAGRTGHAEVVQITFDPDVVTYRELIDYFWKTHDATDGRGVWPDFGRQYRSIILAHDAEQRRIAKASRDAAQEGLAKPIATELVMLDTFYLAEDYHQDYVKRNPRDRYVLNITVPKLKKLGLKVP